MSAAERMPFFAVSAGKLLVMSVGTLGFYQLYWFYQNWRHVQAHTGERISPFWRTFFFFVFAFDLFARVRNADPGGQRLPAALLAMLWIVLAIFLTPLAVLPALPAQSVINAVNAAAAPGHDRNGRLSGLNWLAIIVTAFWLGLAVFAMYAVDVSIEP